MQPETWKRIHEYAVGVWSVVGPLLGVLIGAWIASRNQREHWVADNKRREYQELITALTQAFSALVQRRAPLIAYGPEEQRAFAKAYEIALITISDRIFIQGEVHRQKVLERWQRAAHALDTNGDSIAFSNEFGEIKSNLIYEAQKLMQ